MTVCPNCGANIEQDATKCPYCGYINIEGAKKKYQQDIDEIRDNIAEVKKEPAREFKKGLSKGFKVILWTVGSLLVIGIILAVMLVFQLKNHPKMFLSAEDEAYASAYKAVAAEELEAAYQNNDIEEMARIYDKAYSEERVSLWGDPHYETGYASSCYMKLKKCLPNLDKEKMTKREAEEITYYCFYFYYEAYGEDGKDLFDPIRKEEIIPIINNRLGFSDEDMENFRAKVTERGGVVRTNVYKATKKYYKDYK